MSGEDENAEQEAADSAYELVFSPTFTRDLRGLPPSVRRRIMTRLEQIQSDPFHGVVKLKDVEIGIYRVRVGDYRVRFDVEGQRVFLYRVRHRRDSYRGGG